MYENTCFVNILAFEKSYYAIPSVSWSPSDAVPSAAVTFSSALHSGAEGSLCSASSATLLMESTSVSLWRVSLYTLSIDSFPFTHSWGAGTVVASLLLKASSEGALMGSFSPWGSWVAVGSEEFSSSVERMCPLAWSGCLSGWSSMASQDDSSWVRQESPCTIAAESSAPSSSGSSSSSASSFL